MLSAPLLSRLSPLLWGNSIALSWMWGLGLFFSVQFTVLFGWQGLLWFAVPNALGLFVFGMGTSFVARREGGGESLAKFFASWSVPLRSALLFYQFVALALTLFAFVRYVLQPIGMEEAGGLYVLLGLGLLMAPAILLGEALDIRRLKFSHAVLGVVGLGGLGFVLLAGLFGGGESVGSRDWDARDFPLWGFLIPLVVGLLVGPWLDLQQWQRAIQMQREGVSIARSYALGAGLFFLLLLGQGVLTLWALGEGGNSAIGIGEDGHEYGHEAVVVYLLERARELPLVFVAYGSFLLVCLLTTLDSGYVALRWFLRDWVERSTSPLLGLIPNGVLTSPLLLFVAAAGVAWAADAAEFELEYFILFYSTFFVGYAVVGMFHAWRGSKTGRTIPQVAMLALGVLGLAVGALGYLAQAPLLLTLGTLVPLAAWVWRDLGGVVAAGGEGVPEVEAGRGAETSTPLVQGTGAVGGGLVAESAIVVDEAVGGRAHTLGGRFEGKWFVYDFITTYADTNSVGNVYFGMYGMWVGKTRELFFHRVMPGFNIKETPFFILTRSFEHKFVRETKEFEAVSVRLRIASYNRKFVTMEHEIYDSGGNLLGEGKQTLLFVSSTNYKLINIPGEIYTAFVQYA